MPGAGLGRGEAADVDGSLDAKPGRVGLVVSAARELEMFAQKRVAAGRVDEPTRLHLLGGTVALDCHLVQCLVTTELNGSHAGIFHQRGAVDLHHAAQVVLKAAAIDLIRGHHRLGAGPDLAALGDRPRAAARKKSASRT